MKISTPKIEAHEDECQGCGLPADEVCLRCGCECGKTTETDWCANGCKIAIGGLVIDNADQCDDEQELELAA